MRDRVEGGVDIIIIGYIMLKMYDLGWIGVGWCLVVVCI